MYRVSDIIDLQRLDFQNAFIKKIKLSDYSGLLPAVAYSEKISMLLINDPNCMHIMKFI